MTVNPQYQNEYNDALNRVADTIHHLNDYFHNLQHANDKTQYVSSDELHMLQLVQDNLIQYEHASQNYFLH